MREDRAPHSGRTINRILCNALFDFFFMTTTPQTDAFVAHMADQFRDPSWIEFAQDMECENARLRDGLKCAEKFLGNATAYIGVINDHDMPKAIYALDAVRRALANGACQPPVRG